MKFQQSKNIFITLIFALAAAVMAVSCKAARQVEPPYETQGYTMDDSTDFRADYAALASTYHAWTDVKLPVNIKVSSPMSISLGGTATMTSDRAIHLSLRMLGFEVAALLIDGDSIFATYKIQKRYVAESIPQLLRGFPATVGNLQALLLGRIFYPGSDAPCADNISRFSFLPTDDPDIPSALLMQPRADLNGAECVFVSDGEMVPALLAFMAIAGNNQASAIYSDQVNTPAGSVSRICEINGSAAGKKLSARITWDLDKAQWNTGAIPRRLNTRGYTRIPASALIKSLSAL